MRRLVLLAATAAALAGGTTGRSDAASGAPCRPTAASPTPTAEVMSALRSGRDVWGNRLLAAPGGPTLAGASRYLGPPLLARAAGGTPLTGSGVHYLPFGVPAGPQGATAIALHVADGSQIVSRRVGGPSLTAWVGSRGGERYGSCLARLAEPVLAEGWLPLLETRYVDAAGVHYRQESFAARTEGGRALASFMRLTVDARGARTGATVRLVPSRGSTVTRTVARGGLRTVYASWLVGPAQLQVVGATAYDAARRTVVRYWEGRVGEGMKIEVPERRVADAYRALLVQDLLLTWRYSIGNAYEELSFPEGVDVAQVLGEQGFEAVARAILRTALTRPDTRYPNWKMGSKLLGSATHFRLFHDRAYLTAATPQLRGYVEKLGRQIGANGLFPRERYSSDIPDAVYGLHAQTMVWAGLRGMADAWQQTGQAQLAATCRRLAARLESGLRKAVRASRRRLADGSLFVPVRLLDDQPPYDLLTRTRQGSYWNLVMPYALATGFFAPGGTEAKGVLRYLLRHGSRLLGLVRAGAYSLYGREAPFPVGGTDQVYGINAARFLADSGRSDQLVLSLYGQLAAGMAKGTFVAGEAASVAPLAGASRRAMYLPPNGAANAAFLETLRLLLVHETADGVQLAFATPRAWLRAGRRVAVENAPTAFGPVSFAIETHDAWAGVSVEPPTRATPGTLALRLRLPAGRRIAAVTLAGKPYSRFDAATGSIDLSGLRGSLSLRVAVEGKES